jgi:hypothetical protein
MPLQNHGHLAIHRRTDEIAFLQHLLRSLKDVDLPDGGPGSRASFAASGAHSRSDAVEHDPAREVLARKRALADELLRTRQTEPLGEALQRRLAMAERVSHDLTSPARAHNSRSSARDHAVEPGLLSDAYWMAEIERQALAEMLQKWWAWLRDA